MPLKPYQKQSALTRIEEGQARLAAALEKALAPKQGGKILISAPSSGNYNVILNPHQIVHAYAKKSNQSSTTISVASNGDLEEFTVQVPFGIFTKIYEAAINGETVDLRPYSGSGAKELKEWPIKAEKKVEVKTAYKRAGKLVYR